MTTKKQQRAEARIEHAASRRARRVNKFVRKVAVRRLKNPGDANYLGSEFCCLPDSLEMPREEFLSKGQQLCGGAAVFFDRDVLGRLLPNWTCSNREPPVVLMATYVQEYYQEDGSRRDTYRSSSTTSGSIHWP